jgi:hypothetical protein
MKLALILNVIDPKIGGVMIMGDRGTGTDHTFARGVPVSFWLGRLTCWGVSILGMACWGFGGVMIMGDRGTGTGRALIPAILGYAPMQGMLWEPAYRVPASTAIWIHLRFHNMACVLCIDSFCWSVDPDACCGATFCCWSGCLVCCGTSWALCRSMLACTACRQSLPLHETGALLHGPGGWEVHMF